MIFFQKIYLFGASGVLWQTKNSAPTWPSALGTKAELAVRTRSLKTAARILWLARRADFISISRKMYKLETWKNFVLQQQNEINLT